MLDVAELGGAAGAITLFRTFFSYDSDSWVGLFVFCIVLQ
jgi:hypothetical protein